MGNFNSHSPSWGYDDLDHKGDEVEDWTITHNMVLINKADGSAENTTRNGGCGIYIRQPNKPPITIAIPDRDICSNYRAEAEALLTATETVTHL